MSIMCVHTESNNKLDYNSLFVYTHLAYKAHPESTG